MLKQKFVDRIYLFVFFMVLVFPAHKVNGQEAEKKKADAETEVPNPAQATKKKQWIFLKIVGRVFQMCHLTH